MGKVRSRAGVLGAVTGATVLALLPVASLAQVPSVDQVVGGVTDTVGGVVQAPSAPALPANPLPTNPLPANPVPSQPPAVSAPAVQSPAVHAPEVQAPAPVPSAQTPVGSAPQRQQSSAPATTGGSAGARSADPGGGTAGGGRGGVGGAGGGRHSRTHSHATRARGVKHHGQHGSSHAGAAADPSAHGAGSPVDDQLAMADEAAAPLPDDPRPARSPFTGFALGMLLWAGLSGLGLGLAIHRGTLRLHFRRAV